MLIELELNTNDADALLRHCEAYQPDSGDFREDSRLKEALDALASAVKEGMSLKGTVEAVDPKVLAAATFSATPRSRSSGCPSPCELLTVNARSTSMQRKS